MTMPAKGAPNIFLDRLDSINSGSLVKCHPFLKWAGGKRQLLSELHRRLPQKYNRYLEPFIGGGALFFSLQPKSALLADITDDLINCYATVRDDVENLIEQLQTHQYSREYFEQLRAADRQANYENWSTTQRAARLIYLNKTCFNGLYRLNNQGFFNTPFGRYKNPKIVDCDNLRACSGVLHSTNLCTASFEKTLAEASSGDFAYLDPPYLPLNPTSSFIGYSKDKFAIAEQEKLREICLELDRKGVKFMLSNSSHPWVIESYKSYNLQLVQATRAINSKSSLRGKIQEVIVTNYS